MKLAHKLLVVCLVAAFLPLGLTAAFWHQLSAVGARPAERLPYLVVIVLAAAVAALGGALWLQAGARTLPAGPASPAAGGPGPAASVSAGVGMPQGPDEASPQSAQQADRLAVLQRASQAISRSLDLEQVYAATYEAVGQLMPNEAFVMSLLDDDGAHISAVYIVEGGARRPAQRLDASAGLGGHMLKQGRPLLLHTADDWPPAAVRFGDPPLVQSVLAVPMQVGEQVFGMLATESYREHAFTSDDVPLLSTLANEAAAAIRNARLYAVTRRRAEQMQLVNEIGRDIAGVLEVDALLLQVARRLETTFGYDQARLGLVAGEAIVFPKRHAERGGEAMPELRLHVSGPGLVERAVRQAQPCYAAADGTEIASEAAWPLSVHGRTVGVLDVRSRRAGEFGPEDRATLEAVAGLVAVAVDNARLFAEARERAAEVSALLATTLALSSSLDLGQRLDAIARHALALVEADSATIYKLSSDGQHLLPIVALDEQYKEQVLAERVSVGEGVVGYVVRSGRGELVNRVDLDARARQIPGTPMEPESLMAVPLAVGPRTIGVMVVYREGLREFTPHHFDLLSSFAAQAAIAVENAELYERLRERADSLQATYNKLADMDRLKDEMVQNISHELRTPLTFLMSYVDLLLSGELGPLLPEQVRGLDVVKDKTDSLVRLVDDILTLQTVTPATIRLAPLDLNLLARAATDGVAAVASEAGVQVLADLPDTPVSVQGDALRLTQVLDNLLGNAVKFTERGGRIELSLRVLPDRARVEVRDTGVGMSPDSVERVFDRFYQVDGTLTRRRGGIGLGLAIAKLIVEAHGGQMGVDSQFGVGSCFYFSLPRPA